MCVATGNTVTDLLTLNIDRYRYIEGTDIDYIGTDKYSWVQSS